MLSRQDSCAYYQNRTDSFTRYQDRIDSRACCQDIIDSCAYCQDRIDSCAATKTGWTAVRDGHPQRPRHPSSREKLNQLGAGSILQSQ